MAAKTWSIERNRKLTEMYKTGVFTTSEMATALNVSIPTVYQRLARMGLKTTGLPRKYRGPGKHNFSETEKTKIAQLVEEGLPVTLVALKMGRTLGPTRRICRELGLTTRLAKPLKPGERFGALTVVEAADPQPGHEGYLQSCSLMLCDCGRLKTVMNYLLRSRNISSCGCRIN